MEAAMEGAGSVSDVTPIPAPPRRTAAVAAARIPPSPLAPVGRLSAALIALSHAAQAGWKQAALAMVVAMVVAAGSAEAAHPVQQAPVALLGCLAVVAVPGEQAAAVQR